MRRFTINGVNWDGSEVVTGGVSLQELEHIVDSTEEEFDAIADLAVGASMKLDRHITVVRDE